MFYIVDNCTVSTVSGNLKHDRQKGETILTFEADDSNAIYICKLDKGSFQSCKLILNILYDYSRFHVYVCRYTYVYHTCEKSVIINTSSKVSFNKN